MKNKESSASSQTNHASKCKTWRDEEREAAYANIEEIISTLPVGNFILPLRPHQGHWCYAFSPSLPGAMFAQEKFRVKPGDIFVCCSMKTSTRWLKAPSFATATRTHFDNSENPLLTNVPHDCIPFLEKDFTKNYSTVWEPDLPLCSTHVPCSWLPKSIIDSGCKMVYICRDAKDVFVSLWHFMNKSVDQIYEKIPLEEAFELFCKGSYCYGPYWDHELGYWKASLDFPDRVLFLKYEDMMEDTAFYLKRMAEFMGYPFSVEEENEGAVQKIIDLRSFENLSNLEVNKTGKYSVADGEGMTNDVYFRKARVGYWKNYLTSVMGENLDKITKEKLVGSGLKL